MKKFQKLRDIVPVDLSNTPAERFSLIRRGVKTHDLTAEATTPKPVDDGDQVAQFEFGGHDGRLPNYASLRSQSPRRNADVVALIVYVYCLASPQVPLWLR